MRQMLLRGAVTMGILSLLLASKPTQGADRLLQTTAESTEIALSLIVEPNSLVVHVDSPNQVNLKGLQFKALDNTGKPKIITLQNDFETLQLTGGISDPDACYIYFQDRTASTLPQDCDQINRVFKRSVAPADVFWYDSVLVRQRDLVILDENDQIVATCPASLPKCSFSYTLPIETEIVTPPPLPDLPITGPCLLAAQGYSGVKVRQLPSISAPILGEMNPLLTYEVSGKSTPDVTNRRWYQITISGNSGWAAGWVIRLGGDCRNIPEIGTGPSEPSIDPSLLDRPLPELQADGPCVLASRGYYKVNARQKPDRFAGIRGSIDPFEIYDVLGRIRTNNEDWYLTSTGWVAGIATRQSKTCEELAPLTN
jgi:hypothetical protein